MLFVIFSSLFRHLEQACKNSQRIYQEREREVQQNEHFALHSYKFVWRWHGFFSFGMSAVYCINLKSEFFFPIFNVSRSLADSIGIFFLLSCGLAWLYFIISKCNIIYVCRNCRAQIHAKKNRLIQIKLEKNSEEEDTNEEEST